MKNFLAEKNITFVFNITVWLKGLQSLLEISGGIIIFFISQSFVVRIVSAVTQGELSEDANDFLANYLLRSAQAYSLSTQHFVAIYLVVQGLIKLSLVIGLLKNKRWAYPLAGLAFCLFGVYEIYRYTHTHSPWLIYFVSLDILAVWLIIHKYRRWPEKT